MIGYGVPGYGGHGPWGGHPGSYPPPNPYGTPQACPPHSAAGYPPPGPGYLHPGVAGYPAPGCGGCPPPGAAAYPPGSGCSASGGYGPCISYGARVPHCPYSSPVAYGNGAAGQPQHHSYGKQEPQTGTARQSSRTPDCLAVSGCQNETVRGIICGRFLLDVENHGRPVYKKDAQVNNLNVMLYYWDDRDGSNFCGWWLGPRVGGDQVWAYHPDSGARLPPLSGWRVPYDGPEDPSLRVETAPGGAEPHPSLRADGAGRSPSRGRERRRPRGGRREREKQRGGPMAEGPAKGAEAPAKAPPTEEERREEEQRRREEEQRRREEEQKRQAEAEQQRKEAEAARRKEAEERRRQEQKATLAIRRVIQEVRVATPENFEELQKKLQAVLDAELEKTGGQKQRTTEESDKGLEQARKRIEQVNEQQRRELERQNAEAQRRRELEDRARRLVAELEGLVAAAEAGAGRLPAALAPLAEAAGPGAGAAEAERAAAAAEAAGGEVRALARACTDFILARGAEMRDPAAEEQSELKRVLAGMLQRINECSRAAEAAVQQARGARERALRRAAAQRRLEELEALFERYDRDADDALSRREVLAYARGHYGFALPEEALDGIWRHVVGEGQRGVRLERFRQLNVAIGVARERERDAKRRVLREERERVLKRLKGGLQERIREVARAVDEADHRVGEAERRVQPLASRARATPVPEMLALADATDAATGEARAAAGEARRCMDGLGEGLEERYAADLGAFLAVEAKHLELRMGRMDARLGRAANLTRRFRERAAGKRAAELDGLRGAAARVLRRNQLQRGLSDEELFGLLDADGDGAVGEGDWLRFFEAADRDVGEPGPEAEVAEAAGPGREGAGEAAGGAGEAAGGAGEGAAAGVAGEGEGPKDAEEAGQAGEEAGQAGEARGGASDGRPAPEEDGGPGAAGPKALDVARLQRLAKERAREVELTTEGLSKLFAHLAEGAGCTLAREALLCLVHACYKVVQATVLTSAVRPQEGATLRGLEVGEALEGLQPPAREGSAGELRVRVRALADGAEGWATLASSGGAAHLQEASGLLRVLREAVLEPGPEPRGGAASEGARRLREGEALELRAWPRREPRSGALRFRARARSDGAEGWLSPAGPEGGLLAEAL